MDILDLTVEELSRKCLASFDRCLASTPSQPNDYGADDNSTNTSTKAVSQDERPGGQSVIKTPSLDEPLAYRLADFHLWIDGTGALASSKASLDWRLKTRPIDLSLVKGNLVMLYQFLEDYADFKDKHMPLDEALLNVDSSLANLSSLGVAIRRTGRRSRLHKADSRFDQEEHSQLKQHLECIVALRPSEEGREEHQFKQKLESLTPVQHRLVQANLRRRNRFLQAQRHSRGLKKRKEDSFSGLQDFGNEAGQATAVLQPSVPQISNLVFIGAPDIPSTHSDHGNNEAPTVSGTSASMPNSDLKYSDPRLMKSEASTPKTEITRITASAHYPRPQLPGPNHQVFQCPCCCQTVLVQEMKNDDKWRKHLSEDVCPYTCFVEACPTPYILYGTRAALERHVRQDHLPTWQCLICVHNSTFTTMADMTDHVYQSHRDSIEEDDISAILSLSIQHEMGVNACPLCDEKGPINSPELIDHVLEHIHEFSLRSLPWPRPSDVNFGGEVGSYDPECDKTPYVIQWLEGWELEPGLVLENGLSPQLSEFDHSRLAIIANQMASHQGDHYSLELFFADEHGDESAAAETDISPLTQRTLSSSNNTSGVFPENVLTQKTGETHAAEINHQPIVEEPATDLADKLKATGLGPDWQEEPAIVARKSTLLPTGALRRSYDWMLRAFWATTMEVTMLGLEGCGKTSLLRVLSGGEFTMDSTATVGFNMKQIVRNHVTIKVWDIGGQPRFRPMWERYCRGVNCIIFVVDISDAELMPLVREELHHLMSLETIQGIPLLVLGNHSDRLNTLTVDELIDVLDLRSIRDREVSCYGISAKEETNLEAVLQWLIKWANK